MTKYGFSGLQVNKGLGTIGWTEGWEDDGNFVIESWRDQFTKYLISTRDAYVREGLIKLGWTPPPEEKP
jgi:hypothetical protein